MNKKIFEAKTYEQAVALACETLNVNEEEVIIYKKEEKKSLFNKKVEIEVTTKEDINQYVKEYLKKVCNEMNFNIQIELKKRENTPIFNIVCEDAILIGRHGRTIDALQTITTQMLKKNLNIFYRIMIDVNDYKQSRRIRLEKLAKYTAKEVAKTKIEAKLDPMNSYERRIIHNALSQSKDVTTISYGEEPKRYVVIKPKEK